MNKNQGSTTTSIEEQINAAISEAHAICDQLGAASKDCAVAWDIVEELDAEASHQQQAKLAQTSFEKYCDANPGDLECRIYED